MKEKPLIILIMISLIIMILSINIGILTSYTAIIIDLSKQICKGSFFLEKMEWYYTDVIKIKDRYIFAGPIGVPLIISPLECLANNYETGLFIGGLVMSISTMISMIYMYLFIKRFGPYKEYIMASLISGVFASMPWIYSSHIFPQALLMMCYSALLYHSSNMLYKKDPELKDVIMHSLFSGIALLTDPSTIIMIFSISIFILIKLINNFRIKITTYKKLFSIIIIWISIFSIALSFQFYYNLSTTGNPFIFPEIIYSSERGFGTGFVTPVFIGLVAQLIDPRKSLLSLYPISFISLILSIYFYKDFYSKDAFLIYLIMIFVPLMIYSMWHDYHGGLSYGPRFLTPITILLIYSIYIILNRSSYKTRILLFIITIYSMMENSIVVVTSPYSCAFQEMSIFENQFLNCTLPMFLNTQENLRAAVINRLISHAVSLDLVFSSYISAVILFLNVSLLYLYSLLKKI